MIYALSWQKDAAGMLDDYLIAPRWPLLAIAAVTMIWLLLPRSGATPLQLARELLLVVPAYFIYFTVRGLVAGREADAFEHAMAIIDLEQAMGIFWEVDFQWMLLDQAVFVDLANWFYMWAHWPVIIPAAIWLFMLHREEYRLFRNAFLISGAIALVIFATVPVAPPRFLDAWGFVDTVQDHSGALQVMQPAAFTNQYAAMPSLHFGWNLLVGIAIVRNASLAVVRALGALMPIGMLLSIVGTGNHFVIDAVAGAAVVLLALAAATALRSYGERRGEGPARPALAGA